MREVVEAVDAATAGKQVVVASDVGTHQSIVARYFTFDHPRRRFLTSAGLGTMGSGLPYLIGAALELPDHMPILFTGDGSFAIEVPGLATARDLGLPLKVFVLDNGAFGIVRQFEELHSLRSVAKPARVNWLAVADGLNLNWVGDAEASVARIVAFGGLWVASIPVDDVGVWPILEASHRMDDMRRKP